MMDGRMDEKSVTDTWPVVAWYIKLDLTNLLFCIIVKTSHKDLKPKIGNKIKSILLVINPFLTLPCRLSVGGVYCSWHRSETSCQGCLVLLMFLHAQAGDWLQLWLLNSTFQAHCTIRTVPQYTMGIFEYKSCWEDCGSACVFRFQITDSMLLKLWCNESNLPQ